MQLTTWKKNNCGCVGNSFNFFPLIFRPGSAVFICMYIFFLFLKDLSGLTGEGPTLHRIRSAGGVASSGQRGRQGGGYFA